MSLDKYGGLISIKSPKGANGHWRIEKFAKRWMFVTPEGHAFWYTGVYNASDGGFDANASKYGSNKTTWATQTLLRLKSWGFTGLGPYASGWLKKRGLPSTEIVQASGRTAGLVNRQYFSSQVLPPDAFKDLITCLDVGGGYTGWAGSSLPDVFDPNFDGYVNGYIAAISTDSNESFKLTSPWAMGVSADDTDNLFGFSAGLDIPIADGSYHSHIGWIALACSPTLVSGYGRTYLDPTVFSKQQVVAFLKARYATIGALNTAWGSNYTTFDSAGGWKVGTGLSDENGRHTAWLGSTDGTLRGAAAAVQTDLDDFLLQWARKYFQVTTARIRQYAPNMLVWGPNNLNGHGGISRRQILQAAAESVDVLVVSGMSQPVLDLMDQWGVADKPMVTWEGYVANPDSALFAYPQPYSSGILKFNTQAERGAGYASHLNLLASIATSSGVRPVVGTQMWELRDNWGEKTNWGLITALDNAYDGREAVIAPGTDPWGYPTGGEARNYGDFISSVKAANVKALQTICQQLGGCK